MYVLTGAGLVFRGKIIHNNYQIGGGHAND